MADRRAGTRKSGSSGAPSWWRRIKISAACHASSRRDSLSHEATRVIRRKTNRRHMIGDHHGRTAGSATLLVRSMDGILGTHKCKDVLDLPGHRVTRCCPEIYAVMTAHMRTARKRSASRPATFFHDRPSSRPGWMTRMTGPWPSSKARTSVPSAEIPVIIVTPTRHRAHLGRAYRCSRCRACATRPKASRSADARAGPKPMGDR